MGLLDSAALFRQIAERAALAQLVEQLIRNQQIVSSNLTGGSIKSKPSREIARAFLLCAENSSRVHQFFP